MDWPPSRPEHTGHPTSYSWIFPSECNGYEATFALRQDQRTCGTVIVAFTALNDAGDVHKHLVDHSFDGYSQKGQPPSKLVALVMSFLH